MLVYLMLVLVIVRGFINMYVLESIYFDGLYLCGLVDLLLNENMCVLVYVLWMMLMGWLEIDDLVWSEDLWVMVLIVWVVIVLYVCIGFGGSVYVVFYLVVFDFLLDLIVGG